MNSRGIFEAVVLLAAPLAALVVASSAGCSSGDASATGASPDAGTTGTDPRADGGTVEGDAAPAGAAGYCEAIADFFCDFYLRCDRMAVDGPAACKATFLETCNAKFEPRNVALEAKGLLSLSQAGIDACRAHLATVACEAQTQDLQGPCSGIWVGSSPAGAPCGIDVESFVCAPGTTCILGLDFCGTCETAVGVGEACEPGAIRCTPDGACIEGKCVARGVAGTACGETKPCATGLKCVGASPDAGADGTCEGSIVVAENDACDGSHRCPYQTSCIGGTCKRSSLLGEPCSPTRECASGRCIEGTCEPLGADGDTCASGSECRSGLCAKTACAPMPSACFAK